MRTLALLLLLPSFAFAEDAKAPFVFRDVGEASGLLPAVGGIRGHGAAWGDVANTGWPDLFVATFHNQGSKPGMFFRNQKGKFSLDPQPQLRTTGIGSGALFLDLDNRGLLDLYVSNCGSLTGDAIKKQPSFLFRNDGDGKFADISEASGACPPGYEGRGLAALDFDGDGLLDFILCEQYYSPAVKTGPLLFRNLGKHRFENVSEKAGLPKGFGGLALAVADLNGDGWPDLFLSHGGGAHRVYLNTTKGGFVEANELRDVLRWKNVTKNDPPAGVAIADVNGDGLPDILIGHHFKQPWKQPVAMRLYLHRGIKDGKPTYEDVTEAVGLKGLPMKPPHVEIQDFDNDGLPDLYTSIVRYKNDVPHPVIYKNMGNKDGMPRFVDYGEHLNDFPDPEFVKVKKTAEVFDRILKDKKIIYMAPGPSADFDRDGKLDLFLPSWWVESPSLLLRNETPGGHWLQVQVQGSDGVNRMGIGSRVNVYAEGKLGDANARLGSREVAIGYGYCSGQEAIAHFGLGKTERVDVEVILPHGKGTIVQRGVAGDQRITLKK